MCRDEPVGWPTSAGFTIDGSLCEGSLVLLIRIRRVCIATARQSMCKAQTSHFSSRILPQVANSLFGALWGAAGSSPGLSVKATNWRKAQKRGRQARFALSHPSARQRQLAEWVKSPEKNAGSWSFPLSFGGGA